MSAEARRRTPQETTPPILLAPSAGRPHPGFKDLILKVGGEATRGSYSLHEETLEPGHAGPPVHFHVDQEEAFFILEGEVTFILGDQLLTAPAGTFLLVPAGWRHGFANRGQDVARVLGIFSPGGFDHAFDEIGAWMERGGDAAEGRRLSEKHGVQVVGPPLGMA